MRAEDHLIDEFVVQVLGLEEFPIADANATSEAVPASMAARR